MRTTAFLIFFLALFAINACTPMIYGVPEAQWNQMTSAQRQAAIEGYNERAKIREQRRLAESRRAAEKAKEDRIRAEIEARRERERIAAIYAGRAGRTGDLLQVSIRGGRIKFGGRHREYWPVSFRIAIGDRKPITFRNRDKHGPRSVTVWVEYRDGTFIFDAGPARHDSRYARKIRYKSVWHRGITYAPLSLGRHSVSEAEHISITIRALPIPGHRG
jgi:hypothetical protein